MRLCVFSQAIIIRMISDINACLNVYLRQSLNNFLKFMFGSHNVLAIYEISDHDFVPYIPTYLSINLPSFFWHRLN